MKKKLITGLCLVTLLATGCASDANREEDLINASKSYFEENMSGLIGVDEATITLDMLLTSGSKDKYDLKSLEKCEKDSSVTFELTDGQITNTKVELNCK